MGWFGVSGVGGQVLGLSGPGVGVWNRPCWYCVLHQLLGFVADFLEVFWVAEGCFLAGRSGMYIVVVVLAFQELWSFEGSKTADINILSAVFSSFEASGLLGGLCSAQLSQRSEAKSTAPALCYSVLVLYYLLFVCFILFAILFAVCLLIYFNK